jgi:hypothetical protein
MTARLVVLVALGCLATAGVEAMRQTPDDPPPQSLSFMTARDWQRAPRETRVVLAADFMRVFCVRPTMSPIRLADCLDGDAQSAVPFDNALACIKVLQQEDEP